MFCTSVFVMAGILVKDSYSGLVNYGEKNQKWWATATIAMTFTAMVYAAKNHTASFINPAIAVANHLLSLKLFKANTVHDDVMCVYLLGAFIGAVIAGTFSWCHKWFVFKMETEGGESSFWD